ncbi:hypothetical protein A2U01_0056905, partial [Trifolium medium]|nr:hypothetical protein [Trifolium medium]
DRELGLSVTRGRYLNVLLMFMG